MPSSTAAIVVACISGAGSLVSVVWVQRATRRLEKHKDILVRQRVADAKAQEAIELVGKYRDPLLQSAFDLQSRIYNVLGPGGFTGKRHPEYFRLSTLFVFAQFFGWLEIIRREMQFLDLGATQATQELGRKVEVIQGTLAGTSRYRDEFYIYRAEQRAIGEFMLVRLANSSVGPKYECLGYAGFVAKKDDREFEYWFGRLGEAVVHLPGNRPDRLVAAQRALIDLIDLLDPDHERFHERRARLDLPASGPTRQTHA
jgi:hypothetical protein